MIRSCKGVWEFSNKKLTSHVMSHCEKFRECFFVFDGFNLVHDDGFAAFVTLLRALVGSFRDESKRCCQCGAWMDNPFGPTDMRELQVLGSAIALVAR